MPGQPVCDRDEPCVRLFVFFYKQRETKLATRRLFTSRFPIHEPGGLWWSSSVCKSASARPSVKQCHFTGTSREPPTFTSPLSTCKLHRSGFAVCLSEECRRVVLCFREKHFGFRDTRLWLRPLCFSNFQTSLGEKMQEHPTV